MKELARHRIWFGLAAGLCTAALLARFVAWQATVLLAWDALLVAFAGTVWIGVVPMGPDETRQHARIEFPNLVLADSIVIGAAVACLAAVALILVKAANATGGTKAFLVAVGVLSVVLSWATVHTLFTLRYARTYYAGPAGEVDFNEDTPPDYRDFAYLAFTIGMTFQVSDTDLKSKTIRRTALSHALLSYLFGAVIIGLVINVVGSLLK
jgi:uncharacterized membrane protein